MKRSFQKYAFALLASLALVSCAKDYALVGAEREKGTYMALHSCDGARHASSWSSSQSCSEHIC